MGSIPIGYGIAVTAMQMLDVYTTIANDGVARPPRLVAATIDADGKRHDEPLRRAAPGRVGGDRRRGAPRCSSRWSTDGTGTKAADPRLPGGGQDRHRAEGAVRHRPTYIASFAGFAPADDPAPRGDRGARRARAAASSAADAAAPVFQQIMQFALDVRAGADDVVTAPCRTVRPSPGTGDRRPAPGTLTPFP